MQDTSELLKRLENIAWNQSIPFCYTCYHDAPSGRCATCHSDDLMRIVHGVGCEWGIEWVVRHLVETNLTPVDVDEAFEESIRSCYPETAEVGWLTVDTVDTIKTMDPISWDVASGEWVDAEVSEGNLITLDNGGSHFSAYDIERYLDDAEASATSDPLQE